MKNLFTFMQLATLMEAAKTDTTILDGLIAYDPEIRQINFTLPEQRYLDRKKAELFLVYANK